MAQQLSVSEQAENLVATIKARALEYAIDTYRFPSAQDILTIENAMLIGASIAQEKQLTISSEPVS